MIVRVAPGIVAFLMSQHLKRPVCDHLIGIHICRRTGPALNHINHKLVVIFAVLDLAACQNNCIPDAPVKQSQLEVRLRCRFLNHGKCLDQRWEEIQRHP